MGQVGQVGQEFQVGNAGKKGQEGRVGQVGQVGWCVKVWEGGPEVSGGVNRKFLYCAFSHLLVVSMFINDRSRLFAETVPHMCWKVLPCFMAISARIHFVLTAMKR